MVRMNGFFALQISSSQIANQTVEKDRSFYREASEGQKMTSLSILSFPFLGIEYVFIPVNPLQKMPGRSTALWKKPLKIEMLELKCRTRPAKFQSELPANGRQTMTQPCEAADTVHACALAL